MPAKKRSARPLEIALTEEQIEGIIAEAASRTRAPGGWPSSPVVAPGVAEPVAGYAPTFSGIAPAPVPASASPKGTVSEPESELEVERHRRNVFRQLRGREPRAR